MGIPVVAAGGGIPIVDGELDAGDVALANGSLLAGNASGVAAAVTMSGDATITNAGVITVADVTVGSDAQGDILLRGASAYSRLGVGSGGDELRVNRAANALVYGPPGRRFTRIVGCYCAPVGHKDGIAGALADGADTTITNVSLGNGYPNMVIYNTGTNNANEMPLVTVDSNCCDGLALPSTNTDNVGGTITFGGNMPALAAAGVGPTCFTVGTDPAFYMECRIGIPDISEYDVLGVGFVEPASSYVAAIDTTAELQQGYDEKAMFCLADNAGDVDINTSLAGSDTNTDLTVDDWSDDEVKTMRINVSAAGVVTYQWWDAGTEDTSTGAAAFTFADTTVVTPCIIFAKAAANTDTPPIIEYIEWGYQ